MLTRWFQDVYHVTRLAVAIPAMLVCVDALVQEMHLSSFRVESTKFESIERGFQTGNLNSKRMEFNLMLFDRISKPNSWRYMYTFHSFNRWMSLASIICSNGLNSFVLRLTSNILQSYTRHTCGVQIISNKITTIESVTATDTRVSINRQNSTTIRIKKRMLGMVSDFDCSGYYFHRSNSNSRHDLNKMPTCIYHTSHVISSLPFHMTIWSATKISEQLHVRSQK